MNNQNYKVIVYNSQLRKPVGQQITLKVFESSPSITSNWYPLNPDIKRQGIVNSNCPKRKYRYPNVVFHRDISWQLITTTSSQETTRGILGSVGYFFGIS